MSEVDCLTKDDEERLDLVGALSAIEWTLLNPHEDMNYAYIAEVVARARDYLITPN